MSPWTTSQIGQLVVHARADAKPNNLRNEIGILLNGTDLLPRALAPGSILVVRSVIDPIPAAIRDSRSRLRTSLRWEGAMRDQMSERMRTASRPERGAIPDDCEAVVFQDEAEMLACLALDLGRGEAGSRWWWQHVRPKRWRNLADLMMEESRLVPAVIETLAVWRAADTVMQTLGPSELRAVSNQLTATWGTPSLEAFGSTGTGSPPIASETNISSSSEVDQIVAEVFPRPMDPSPVALERAALIGLARAVFRRPALAREPEFANAAEAWWEIQTGEELPANEALARGEGEGSEPHSDETGRQPSSSRKFTPSQPDPEEQTPSEHSAEAIPLPPPGPGDQSPTEHPPSEDGALPPLELSKPPEAPVTERRTESPEHGALREGSEEPASASESSGWSKRALDSAAASQSEPEHGPSQESSDSDSSPRLHSSRKSEDTEPVATAPDREDQIEFFTELGGVFYLVPLIIDLDPPPALSWWAILEALARELLPAERFEADPLWPALRELDGRASDGSMPREIGRWLEPALPEVRKRLKAIASECEQEPTADFELAPLIQHRARVVITRARVDVIFRLEQILMPVRRAGLDQDPGWRPELGRVVRLHYR